jgi:hypothetical protein
MVPPAGLCQRARAQHIPRRGSSVGAQRSGVEDVTRSGSSLGCVAHFNRHLPGADTLGPPSPEPSNHQRKPLRWPPIPHDEAATRPALDPPATMAAATDDQVLIGHRAPFRLVLKCDGTVVRVTVSWWRDRPQEPATNTGGQPGNATHPSGDRPRSIRSGARRTLAQRSVAPIAPDPALTCGRIAAVMAHLLSACRGTTVSSST